jgi:hypothetical protein
MPAVAAQDLRQDHERLEASLDRLRQIADALDDADSKPAVEYVAEAPIALSQRTSSSMNLQTKAPSIHVSQTSFPTAMVCSQ